MYLQMKPINSYNRVGHVAAAVAFCLVAAAGVGVLRAEQPFARKISGEILGHRQTKIRPAGVNPQVHTERMESLGLNSRDLDQEEVAFYVSARLTAVDCAALDAQGVKINRGVWVPPVPGQHPFGFHIGVIKYASLGVVQNDARFLRLESLEHTAFPHNDVARAVTNADPVHAGNGISAWTGAGVDVAVLDSGCDLGHADFSIPIEAYDVTDNNNNNPPDTPTGPAGWGTNVANTVMDHGTHVSGSAIGDGSASLGIYAGGAPQANFLFYKIGNDTNAGSRDPDMIEAYSRAMSVGADVITMSYGASVHTYSDGSSSVCQVIDAATAAGAVCVVSAGNDQWSSTHDSVSVQPATTSAVFTLRIDNSLGTAAYSGVEDIRVLWQDGISDNNMLLAINNLNAGESLGLGGQPNWFATSMRGTEGQQYILTVNVPAGTIRTYNLTLQNMAGGGQTPLVHVYVAGGFSFFVNPDPNFTINHPAVADTAFVVGAWTHRNAWVDWQGSPWTFTWLTQNTLAPFSSLGPRIDGAPKPDVVGPGAVMISTKDSNNLPLGCPTPNLPCTFPLNPFTIDNDGINDGNGPANYYTQFGTSMAAPFIAGLVACVRQAVPSATPAQVTAALASTASNAGAPNNNVGSGMADLMAAIQSVDCNDNGIHDPLDISSGGSQDCNTNALPDECDLATGTSQDCNANTVLDECDISSGTSLDCNTNSEPDDCDIVSGPLQFGSEINSGIGTNFMGTMVSGRFDGDANMDIAYQAAGTLYVALGNGDATFNLLAGVPAIVPGLKIAADVDGDGDADLIGAIEALALALSNGDGTFAGVVNYPPANTGSASGDTAVADMDGDGILDLAVAEAGVTAQTSGVSIHPGNGDGTFATPTLTPVGAGTRSVTLGDFDNDGFMDVVVAFIAASGDEIAVLMNNGDGTFATPATFAVAAPPQAIATADFDMDGDLDLAVVYFFFDPPSNDLSLHLNTGNGTFAAPAFFSVAPKSLRIYAADFNLDGLPDIAVGHYNDFSRVEYSMLLSNGNGTLTSPFHLVPPTEFIADSQFGDFDNDGDPDWVFHQSFQASVLPNITQSPVGSDCNQNGVPDGCDITAGTSNDCQSDGMPDECQRAGNDCDGNGTPDECELSNGDCNSNAILDSCEIAAGVLADTNTNGVPDICETSSAPAAASSGSRSVTVSVSLGGVASGGGDLAIYVTSPDFTCLAAYVQADGTLGSNAVFQSPAIWGGEVVIADQEIVPSATYLVQLDTGSQGSPSLTDPAEVMTWLWGDVDNNGVANFGDIQLAVQGFQGNFGNANLEAMDLEPCIPNGVVNFSDIQRDVQAFQGQGYAAMGCAAPCGG